MNFMTFIVNLSWTFRIFLINIISTLKDLLLNYFLLFSHQKYSKIGLFLKDEMYFSLMVKVLPRF